MPTTDKRDAIENAIAELQNAQAALLQASLASSDAIELARIKAQSAYLTDLMGQLVHTRLIADDAVFDQATATIKQTAAHLNEQAEAIDQASGTIATLGKVAGYLAQAAAFIAGL